MAPAADGKGTAWLVTPTSSRLFQRRVIDDNGHIDSEGGCTGASTIASWCDRLISTTGMPRRACSSRSSIRASRVRPSWRTRIGAWHLRRAGRRLSASMTSVFAASSGHRTTSCASQKLIASRASSHAGLEGTIRQFKTGGGLARATGRTAAAALRGSPREFAPYVGVASSKFTGNTASLVAAEGGPDIRSPRAHRPQGVVLIVDDSLGPPPRRVLPAVRRPCWFPSVERRTTGAWKHFRPQY